MGFDATSEDYNVFKFPRVMAVPWLKIRESGIVDLDKLYEEIWKWFVENKYITTEKNETEKQLPDGKDLKIIWQGWRKVDDYIRFWINVEIWIVRCVDVVVEENGEKVTRQKGDIEIRFYAEMEKDYESKFKRTKFGQFIRFVLDRYLIKKRLIAYRDKLRAETYELYDKSKEIMRKLVV